MFGVKESSTDSRMTGEEKIFVSLHGAVCVLKKVMRSHLPKKLAALCGDFPNT